MRARKTYIVLSFRTTLEAMEWENQCMTQNVPGRLIPLPREISAGCGLAWRMEPAEYEQKKEQIHTFGIETDQSVELVI